MKEYCYKKVATFVQVRPFDTKVVTFVQALTFDMKVVTFARALPFAVQVLTSGKTLTVHAVQAQTRKNGPAFRLLRCYNGCCTCYCFSQVLPCHHAR